MKSATVCNFTICWIVSEYFRVKKKRIKFWTKIVILAIVSNSWICSADSEGKRFNLGDAMYIKVKTFSIQKLVLASSNEWCINLYCDTIFWTYLNLTTMGLNNFCRSVFSLFQLHFGVKSFLNNLKIQIYQSIRCTRTFCG